MKYLKDYKQSLINELFDKPVKYKFVNKEQISEHEYSFTYEFVIKISSWNSIKYIVSIATQTKLNLLGKIRKTADVAFSLKNYTKYSDDPFGKTGTGNELIVFSTVMTIIKDFIRNDPSINKITFTSEKDEYTSDNRSSLYKKMVKRYLPSGWKEKISDYHNYTQFELYKQ
jgi:hypothetical protein